MIDPSTPRMGPRERKALAAQHHQLPAIACSAPPLETRSFPKLSSLLSVWSGTASAARADAIADTAATPPPRELLGPGSSPVRRVQGASSPRQVEG